MYISYYYKLRNYIIIKNKFYLINKKKMINFKTTHTIPTTGQIAKKKCKERELLLGRVKNVQITPHKDSYILLSR